MYLVNNLLSAVGQTITDVYGNYPHHIWRVYFQVWFYISIQNICSEHLQYGRDNLITNGLIGTDCKGGCKSNYHTITTMTVPIVFEDN
jgi:hypothetical protein